MDNHTPKIPSFDCGKYDSDFSKIKNMKRVRVWPKNWVCLSLTSSCGARIYGGDAMMYPSSKAQWSLVSPSWTHTSACWSRCPAFKPASGAFSERELRKVKKPLPFSRNSMKMYEISELADSQSIFNLQKDTLPKGFEWIRKEQILPSCLHLVLPRGKQRAAGFMSHVPAARPYWAARDLYRCSRRSSTNHSLDWKHIWGFHKWGYPKRDGL